MAKLIEVVQLERDWRATMADAEAFTRDCEDVNYDDRMKRMVVIGQLSRTDSQAKELIERLRQGSTYHRLLALQSTWGSGDVELALEASTSPSQLLSQRAVDVVRRRGSNAQVLQSLSYVSEKIQVLMACRLWKSKRRDIVDEFILSLRDTNARLFKRLLPIASSNVVESHLATIFDSLDPNDWIRLATFHPTIAYEKACQHVLKTVRLEYRHHTIDVIITYLARSHPGLALDVAKRLTDIKPLQPYQVQELIRKRPKEMAQIILDSKQNEIVSLSSVINKLETSQLLQLFERYPRTIPQLEFHNLRPDQRLAVYGIIREGWRTQAGILNISIVKSLPEKERLAEVQRHLDLPVFETNPLGRCPYIGLLPWGEGLRLQQDLFESDDANERATAVSTQIDSVSHQLDHMIDAIKLVSSRQFEQDPVRVRILQSLAQLPQRCWKNEHVEPIIQLVRDLLDKTDLSRSSVEQLLWILGKILPFEPHLVSSQYATILREREQFPDNPKMILTISEKDTRQAVLDSLLIAFKHLHTSKHEDTILSIAVALDTRVHEHSSILQAIEEIFKTTKSAITVSTTLGYLKKHLKSSQFAELVINKLQSDPTCIFISSIRQYIQMRQQHLLTTYLVNEVELDGQFAPETQPTIRLLDAYFNRWSETQQALFAKSWKDIIDDKNEPSWKRVQGLQQMSRLAFIDLGVLISYADHPEPLIQFSTLSSIGRLDGGQGVPVLLEALNDKRARVAIYALRASLNRMPKSQGLKILQSVPMVKVTVSKEVVRLIAGLECEDAFQTLLALEKTKLHKHVRVALMRALYTYKDRQETLEIFEKGAQGSDVLAARETVGFKSLSMSHKDGLAMTKMITLLLSNPSAHIRHIGLNCLRPFPVPDGLFDSLVDPLSKLLASSVEEEVKLAARRLVELFSIKNPSVICGLFKRLLTNRSILSTVFNVYLTKVSIHAHGPLGVQMDETSNKVLEVLEKDPLTSKLRLKLTLKLQWTNIVERLPPLVSELHADALVEAEGYLDKFDNRSVQELDELEGILASSENEKVRRLGLSVLLAHTKKPRGWTKELRERLVRYQTDASELVAEAACFVFPPAEETQKEESEKSGKLRRKPWNLDEKPSD